MAESIAEALQPLAVPLTRLVTLPGNPNLGDVDAVARSYDVFGQRKPIVARRTGLNGDGDPVGMILAGNTQYAAAERLGWDRIAVVWTDDDELTAKAYALADNQTADLGTTDEAALAAMLQDVAGNARLLEASAFTERDLARLLAEPVDPNAEWDGMPPFEQGDLRAHWSTVVNFASDADADAFFEKLGRPRLKSWWWPESDGHVGLDWAQEYVAETPEQ
jgi:hypothetical protein